MNNIYEPLESETFDGNKNPRLTTTLIGQDKAWSTFLNCKRNEKIHHAWILSGPKGIGKATLSWKIASYLLNEIDQQVGSSSTNQSLALSNPNLFLCQRPFDEKTKRLKKFIPVDEIRKLKSFFNLSATENNWRVAIIDCADDLNTSSSNALLKILEEPPKKSIFLIVTHQSGKLPTTIRSRCRSLKLKKLTENEIEEALRLANYNISHFSENDRHILSILAEGSVGMAIRAIANEGILIFKNCLEILLDYPQFDRKKILNLSSKVGGDSEKFKLFSSILLIIVSRIALLSTQVKYINASQQEHLLMLKLKKSAKTSYKIAEIHTDLSNSFQTCYELNLDTSTQILNAFADIEEKWQ